MHLRYSAPPTTLFVLGLLIALIACFTSTTQAQVSFAMPPTYAGSGTVFEADFNDDGKPDILTADGTLQLGKGDGTFTAATLVAAGTIAVGDFNSDGKPDLLQEATGTLLVLLGNGDGTFQPAISTNSGASLTLVAAADLNGDGKADVVGIFNNNTLSVYLSKGDGTFAAGVQYNLGTLHGTPQLVFGDFNGDHATDILVSTAGSPAQEIVFLGNGDGTFQSTPIISPGVPAATSVTVGDFNGDGRLDLSTAAAIYPNATVYIQLGNGDGTFQTPTTACSGPFSAFGFFGPVVTLATTDLNGDGKLDLVLSANLIEVCLGNGDGTFSSIPNFYQPVSIGLAGIAIADFNLDGKQDVAAGGEVLLGNGNGKLQGPDTVLIPGSGTVAVAGRFVKNGNPGLAVNGVGNNSLYILSNDGTGNLSLAHTYRLPQQGSGIATADINGDGNLDLIIEGSDSSGNWSYTVLLGNGDGSFQQPVLYQQSGQIANFPAIVIADFNNDSHLDIAVQVGNSAAVLLGNGNGTFGSTAYFFDGAANTIVSADFNGDGSPDIAASGPSGLAILLGKGDGTFQPAGFPYTTALGSGLLTGDLNGDGKLDLVAATSGIQVFLGNGDGTFTTLPLFSSAQFGLSPAVLADVNGDGKLDLITYDYLGSSTEGNAVFVGKGDGTFDSTGIYFPYNYPPKTNSPTVQVSDMNGDGKPDLVIASPVSTVFVLLNTTTDGLGLTAASTTASVTAGSPATYTLSIGGAGWSGQAALTCSIASAPTGTSCSVSPTNIAVKATSASSLTVTVTTTSRTMATALPMQFHSLPWLWAVALMGFVILPASSLKESSKCKSSPSKFMRALPLLLIFLFPACGGGGTSSGGGSTGPQTNPNGTPAGTYTVTVTATSAGTTPQSMPLTLTVK